MVDDGCRSSRSERADAANYVGLSGGSRVLPEKILVALLKCPFCCTICEESYTLCVQRLGRQLHTIFVGFEIHLVGPTRYCATLSSMTVRASRRPWDLHISTRKPWISKTR